MPPHQALLTPVLVRVGGRVSAAYGVASSVSIPAGGCGAQVRIMNAGLERWDRELTLPGP